MIRQAIIYSSPASAIISGKVDTAAKISLRLKDSGENVLYQLQQDRN